MAKNAKSKDYFGLPYILSLIFAIIPVTAWLFGIITRISEGKILAGVVRILLGWLAWPFDLVCMIIGKHIFRLFK